MTDEGKDRTLEYRQEPKRGVLRTVGLVVAILVAVGVGGLCALAALFMAGDRPGLAGILVGGIVVLIVGAVVAGKKGLNAAVAIGLVAVGAFLLMVGVCSQFTFRMR